MKRLLRTSILLFLTACSDDPAGPDPVAFLDILWNQAEFSATTIQVGQTLELDAAALARDGSALEGRVVTWTSSAPEIASVDTAGLVTGLAVGEASIIARSERAADTVSLTVIAPPSSSLSCEEATTTLQLEVGEVRTIDGNQALTLCVSGGTGGEFVYIPFNSSDGEAVDLELRSSGVFFVDGPPDPVLIPDPLSIPYVSNNAAARRLIPDDGFHSRLREGEDRLIQGMDRREGAEDGQLDPSIGLSPSFAQAPAPGEIFRLNVNTGADYCTEWDYRTGRVEVVTDHAVIVADTMNPAGGFTTEEYREIAETFDDLVYPVSTSTFGTPSDVDDNGRVLIFYTRAVNELTQPNSSSYVGGYYYGGDLKPASGDNACKGSNEAEIFYMLVPDPGGEVNSNPRSKEFVTQKTISVLAHEFQHLINFSRRVFENDALVAEATWLNEGLSHIAEELVFYEAAGLEPGGNLASDEIQAANASEEFFKYQVDNITRFIHFLQNPSRSSPMGRDVLSTRGAAWSFLRYAADRQAGEDGSLWFALVNSTTSGLENLENVLDAEPLEWMEAWATSVYTDDTGVTSLATYDQPSWNLRALIPAFRDINDRQKYERYPLNVDHLTPGDVEHQSLAGGGASFVRFAVPSGDSAVIRMTHNGFSAPPYIQVTIIRTR